VVAAAGYPPHLALVLAVPLALAPLTLWLLLYLGHRRNGRFSLDGVVLYRERIPLRRYFFWVPTVFVVSVTVFAMGGAVLDERPRAALFAWMPSLDWGWAAATPVAR
jgi:CAAX protease family protein